MCAVRNNCAADDEVPSALISEKKCVSYYFKFIWKKYSWIRIHNLLQHRIQFEDFYGDDIPSISWLSLEPHLLRIFFSWFWCPPKTAEGSSVGYLERAGRDGSHVKTKSFSQFITDQKSRRIYRAASFAFYAHTKEPPRKHSISPKKELWVPREREGAVLSSCILLQQQTK